MNVEVTTDGIVERILSRMKCTGVVGEAHTEAAIERKGIVARQRIINEGAKRIRGA